MGKSTFLRAVACRFIEVPKFMHVIHVEQECDGDDRTALQTVLQADGEREWLLKMEQDLLDDVVTEEEAGITLNSVYERLEELDSDSAERYDACLLSCRSSVIHPLICVTSSLICFCLYVYTHVCVRACICILCSRAACIMMPIQSTTATFSTSLSARNLRSMAATCYVFFLKLQYFSSPSTARQGPSLQVLASTMT